MFMLESLRTSTVTYWQPPKKVQGPPCAEATLRDPRGGAVVVVVACVVVVVNGRVVLVVAGVVVGEGILFGSGLEIAGGEVEGVAAVTPGELLRPSGVAATTVVVDGEKGGPASERGSVAASAAVPTSSSDDGAPGSVVGATDVE